MKITVIGNSVALRVRPPQAFPENKNYTCLIRSRLSCNIRNEARGALTIAQVVKDLDFYISTFPDWYIINLGVVESCSRESPYWFYRIAMSKSKGLMYRTANWIYRFFFAKFRRELTNLRFRRSWLSQRKFRWYFDVLIKLLLKETNARIIVLGINLSNDRVETLLPGSRKKNQEYDAIMREACNYYGQTFIDVSKLESGSHYPDGVHYNVKGHEIIASYIADAILSRAKG